MVEKQGNLLLVDVAVNKLRQEIMSLRDIPGARLGDERYLSEWYGVSRKTIRHALDKLKKENLIRSERGKGTFIVPKDEKKKTGFVNIVYKSKMHPYSLMFLEVASNVCRECGYLVNILHYEDARDTFSGDNLELIGTLVAGPFSREDLRNLIGKFGRPITYIGDLAESIRGTAECDTVLADNSTGAFKATEYLLREGHTRIGFLSWNGDNFIWNKEMLRGYKDSLSMHGIEPDPAWIIELKCPKKDGRLLLQPSEIKKQFYEYFGGVNAPTALVHYASSESLLQQITHEHIKLECAVVVTFWEMVLSNYKGIENATAVCTRFDDVVRLALNFLKTHEEGTLCPRRQIFEQSFLCHRIDGHWQKESIIEA